MAHRYLPDTVDKIVYDATKNRYDPRIDPRWRVRSITML